VLVLVVVILLGLLVARLRRGPAGRMLLAIRSNERAAGSVGINVAQAKLMAFGLAAFIAGIGGALTGYMQGELTADSFAAFTSISLLAIVFVAGVGRIAGAVVAGVMFSAAGLFVTFLNIHLNVGKYQAIVAGIALVLTAVQNPDGLTSTSTGKGPAVALEKLRDRALGQYQKRRPEQPRRKRRYMTTTRPARAWAEVTGGDALGRGQQPALCWWLPEGSSVQHAYRLRTDDGYDTGRVEGAIQSFVRLPVFDRSRRSVPGAGQGVDRRGRERVERARSARIRPARGAGLAGPVDRRAGGRTAGEGIAARLLAQDAHRRSPGGRGPAVPHRARPVRGVPGRDACRRRRTRAGYTQYRARVQYQAYDVTSLARPGGTSSPSCWPTGGTAARSGCSVRPTSTAATWRCAPSSRRGPGRAGRSRRPASRAGEPRLRTSPRPT
jgi:hypothetical protein